MTPSPSITQISPTSGVVGTEVVIKGENFGTEGVVTFSGISAPIISWSDTEIRCNVPDGVPAGSVLVIVTVAGVDSNVVYFEVLPPPDTQPPSVSVSHSPIEPTIADEVIFTTAASDNVWISKVELYIDGVLRQRWYEVGTFTYNAGKFTTGSHTYYAIASDTVGNTPHTDTYTFAVIPYDTTPSNSYFNFLSSGGYKSSNS